MNKLTSIDVYNKLKNIDWENCYGMIIFDMANVTTQITATDTVGMTLQSWLKEYFIKNNIYFREQSNTQEFPDFFLDESNLDHMLEIKSFNYNRTPAFDIANFDSYCDSVKEAPYRLYADYLIFGYEMTKDAKIYIRDIWLKKIWEIAGTSKRFKLKTQVKRDVIYNIRPSSDFKYYRESPFKNEAEFIDALYHTIKKYKSAKQADEWLNDFKNSYFNYYNKKFNI